MTRRDEVRLRSFTDRYVKADRDIKNMEAKKKKFGDLLQQEMERTGMEKAEGTVANVSLIRGTRIVEIPSTKFYESVPESMRSRAWEAMSVLVEKARKLVGEDVLRDLGKSVPFARLLIKRKNGEEQTEREAA